jgi:hypothetical protein
MSCDIFRVARKFQTQESLGTAATAGTPTMPIPLAGLRPATRARKIPALRRRVPLVIISEHIEPVKIRHARQNVGSAVSGIQPAQSQRV